MSPKASLRKTKPLLVRFSEQQRERLAAAIERVSEQRGEVVSAQALIRELVMDAVNRLLAEPEPLVKT